MDNGVNFYSSVAFLGGIILTLGFKDFYPDLEFRFWRRRNEIKTHADAGPIENGHIDLEDHEKGDGSSKRVPEGVEACIGNTPLFKIKSLSQETGCEIFAKAEFLNGGGGSPKDRVALSIINLAEEQGLLTPHSGDTIYEGTVGSTGISLATVCRARGYLAHICMPSDQAVEKSELLLKLGAVVDRVPPAPIIDPMHFVNRARNLALEHTRDPSRPGRGLFADQFENQANWQAHFSGTGPEIFRQCGGELDAFVAGAGTGGTITGVGRYLKSRLPKIKILLSDPQGSGLYNRIKYGVMFNIAEKEGTRRRSQIDTIVEGIGINRLTANFEAGRELIDDAIKVGDDQAIAMARWLVEKDGIFVGSSSAVNCIAAVKTARALGPGYRIATILCDSGTRHISKFWAKAGNIGGRTDGKLEDIIGE
ncbi:Cysteine synthase 2 [Lecanora helva]